MIEADELKRALRKKGKTEPFIGVENGGYVFMGLTEKNGISKLVDQKRDMLPSTRLALLLTPKTNTFLAEFLNPRRNIS